MTHVPPANLYLMADCLDGFADQLTAHSTAIQAADASTGWRSRAASLYRDRLTWLRADLLVAASSARSEAEHFRTLAWQAAKDR